MASGNRVIVFEGANLSAYDGNNLLFSALGSTSDWEQLAERLQVMGYHGYDYISPEGRGSVTFGSAVDRRQLNIAARKLKAALALDEKGGAA